MRTQIIKTPSVLDVNTKYIEIFIMLECNILLSVRLSYILSCYLMFIYYPLWCTITIKIFKYSTFSVDESNLFDSVIFIIHIKL